MMKGRLRTASSLTPSVAAALLCLLLAPTHVAARPQGGSANGAGAPGLVVRTGHHHGVSAVAFSRDMHLLASGDGGGNVKLWDWRRGRELRTLTAFGAGGDRHIKTVAFDPDGRLLAALLGDGIRVWAVSDGEPLAAVGERGFFYDAAFSVEHGGALVSLSSEGVFVYDAASGKTLRGFEHDFPFPSALSRGGRWALSPGDAEGVELYDTLTGELTRHSVAGFPHTGAGATRIMSVALSRDGRKLAAATSDGRLRLWDVYSGKELWARGPLPSLIDSLTFSPRDDKLLSGDADGTLTARHAADGRELYATKLESVGGAAAFSGGGEQAAVGDSTKVKVLNAGTGEVTQTLESAVGRVADVAFSPRGDWVATGHGGGPVRLWDMAAGQWLRPLADRSASTSSIDFSRDGKLLVSGHSDGSVEVWDVAAGRQRRGLGAAALFKNVAFSPDGHYVLRASHTHPIRLLNVRTGKSSDLPISNPGQGHRVVKFSPDGRHVLFSRETEWSDSPEEGRRVVTESRNPGLVLWDVRTRGEARVFRGHVGTVEAAVFTADGRTLASGGTDRTVRLWDVQSGRQLKKLEVHTSTVNALAFSHDGGRVASGAEDGIVQVWDARADRTTVLGVHAADVTALAFSPDGRWLVSGGDDGTTRIWDVERSELALTLIAVGDSADWLAVTPQGLFDGTPVAWKLILWRFSRRLDDVLPVEAFFNDFFHPGLFADVLSGKRPRPPEGVSLAGADRRQPSLALSLSDPATGAEINEGGVAHGRLVNLRVRVAEATADTGGARPGGSGARDVRLFRNGTLIKMWNGDALAGDGHCSTTTPGAAVCEATVTVVAGRNVFTAYAFNRDNIKSEDARLFVNGGGGLRRRGTLYVIAVGINRYSNPHFNLRYAVSDANLFAGRLARLQRGLGRYDALRVITLLDRDATRDNLLGALARLAGRPHVARTARDAARLTGLRRAQPEDSVVIYFAGHGTADGRRFFLIPHDMEYRGSLAEMKEQDYDAVLRRGVSDEEMREVLEQIDAGQTLLVLDACNSGQLLENEERRRGPLNAKGLAQLAYEKGMYVLAAAQSYQAALETSRYGHGLLTYALMTESLPGGADNRPPDGHVTAGEWLDYAAQRVPQLQSGAAGARKVRRHAPAGLPAFQQPRVFYRRDVDTDPFVIALNRAGGVRSR